jgi:pyruvate/2-oxoglutarate/acetoin dehydrogenase E1 component
MGEQVFQFGDDVVLNVVDGDFQEVFTVTIEILDVYKGIKYDDTAISEVTFLGCY